MITARERPVYQGYTLGQVTDVLASCKNLRSIIIDAWNDYITEEARIDKDTTVEQFVAMIEGVSILGGVQHRSLVGFVNKLMDEPGLSLLPKMLDRYGEPPEIVTSAYDQLGYKSVADGLTLNKLTDRIKNAPKYVVDALIAIWNQVAGDNSRYIVTKTHSGPFNAKDLCDKIAIAAYMDFNFDDSDDEGSVSRFVDQVDVTDDFDLYAVGPWREPRIFLTGRKALTVDAFFAELDTLPDYYTGMLIHYWALACGQDGSHPEEDRTKVSQIMMEVRVAMNDDYGFERVTKFAVVLFEHNLLRARSTSSSSLPVSRMMPVPSLTVATVSEVLNRLRGHNLQTAIKLYNTVLNQHRIFMPSASPSINAAFLQLVAHYPGFMLMGKFLKLLGEHSIVNWNIALNTQRMGDDLDASGRLRLLDQAVGNPSEEETLQLSGNMVAIDKENGVSTVAEGSWTIANPNPDQIINTDSVKLGNVLEFSAPSGLRRGIVIAIIKNEADNVEGFILIARTPSKHSPTAKHTVHHTVHLSKVTKNLGSLFDLEILNG